MTRRALSAALRGAVRNLALVRVDRSCDPHPLLGYAVGLGEWLRYFPLIAIHEERKDIEVCWIGRPTGFPGTSVELREVSPAGRWCTRPSRYQMRSITKIDFGGAYEGALAQIAGDVPADLH